MNIPLGIIEGFYGKPWNWAQRELLVTTLAAHGYRFYLYAPKADAYLRREWQQDYPAEQEARLAAFAVHCQRQEVSFGMGLSPYEAYLNFNDDARRALARKLEQLQRIGVRQLAILFDDMRGDLPDLAERQAEIVAWVSQRCKVERLLVCPSYYSSDPVLDRVFGQRPAGYLQQLGQWLAPDIDIFWTGEEVCSREISPGHLLQVGKWLGRKPVLWDNYPVNDGARMSQYLHVRGFTGRSAANAELLAAHGINPAQQAALSLIPALTLADSYRLGPRYQYGASMRRAAQVVAGEELADMLWRDVLTLQDVGLDQLGERAVALRARYAAVDHPCAREVVAWLDGEYRISELEVQTQ
ncbi:beta-N-acetylglucosaminidase domain-containing protein [Chromobacterium haemolyticum]|uniref:beta-N-acetylglucosaminidase domain-containing protein n=1 Tax=Chromobacterium haemolyticum TaxID=394935 RepID=UPI0009D998A0|nr:beta-N-acetylglucosaminidase domain-containing protein [Chromobacterium haemolyticum]OQS41761.1 hyaluronidase [Chromobacterium haemolyticum]